MVITDFDGQYYFLSNFTYSPFILNGKEYETVEHYFQSMKTTNLTIRDRIRTCGHPRFAKKFGRQTQLRIDWEKVKYTVMQQAVRAKFKQSLRFANLLKATHPYELIEGNTWHDNIWGDCHCDRCKNIIGQNLLGKILMEVRDELLGIKSR